MTDNHTTVGKLMAELEFWKNKYGEDFPVTFVNGMFQPIYPVLKVNDEGNPTRLIFFAYKEPQPVRSIGEDLDGGLERLN